ncbi:MAG: hypothetical protein NXI32_05550 [bacterium]|nr:hypothetical protein [bacterium]
MLKLRSLCLAMLSVYALGSAAFADIIYVYEGVEFQSSDAGAAFVANLDRVTGTVRFDSVGDLTPDVSFSVSSSGNPSLPFTITLADVDYGGSWADTNGDGLLDDPFAGGFGFTLSANRVGGADPEEIFVTDNGDSVGIDVDVLTFTFGHAASNNTRGNFTFVPEPGSGSLLLMLTMICRIRLRKGVAI